MSKFKPGDRVIVACEHPTFDCQGFMAKQLGGEFTIEEVYSQFAFLYGTDRYGFHVDSLIHANPYWEHHHMAREICGGKR